MRYRAVAFFNGSEHRLDHFEHDDELVWSTMVFDEEVSADPEHVAEHIYCLMNAPDRPNGKTESSLSVGDVVALVSIGEERFTTFYEICPVGCKEIKTQPGSVDMNALLNSLF